MKTYYGFKEDSKELHKEPTLCRQFEDSDVEYVFYTKYVTRYHPEYEGYIWFLNEPQCIMRLVELLKSRNNEITKRIEQLKVNGLIIDE